MKIYRSKQDRYVSGVFGGLAEYFSTSADALRLLFILLIVFTPVTVVGGVIAYLIAVVVMPETTEF